MPGIARHTPELTGDKAVRLVIVDTALLPHVGDVLGSLTEEYVWLEDGDTVADIVAASMLMLEDYYDMLLVGSVQMFFSSVPEGWLLCDGTTYNKADYPVLWEVLPAGMRTATQFTLPDFDEVFPMGVTAGADINSTGGENTNTLTVGQLPAHTHTYTPPTATISVETPTTPIPGVTVGAPIATGSTGSGESVDNMPVFRGLFFAVYAGQS